MRPQIKKYLFLFGVAALGVGLDQWTKYLVRAHIPLNQSWLPESLNWLAPYARLVFIYNKGAAFGAFQNGGLIFVILALAVFGAILYYYRQVDAQDRLLQIAAGLYLAGVLGNLIDRLTQGQVTDFISVGKFYIFNIADASINVGVALLALGYWLNERKQIKPSAPEDTFPTDGKTA
ncbi:MAG: signal peptidase II [Anaerolineales bacterium]|nr:signal peptidase II [Anaerolineales bacterium]